MKAKFLATCHIPRNARLLLVIAKPRDDPNNRESRGEHNERDAENNNRVPNVRADWIEDLIVPVKAPRSPAKTTGK